MADVVTNVGEEWIVDALVATSVWGAWGTGAGTAAKADTTLFTESTEARVATTDSKVGTGATAVWRNIFTLTAAAAKTITNYGILSASTGGTLIIHGDHAGVALATNDRIEYTIDANPA